MASSLNQSRHGTEVMTLTAGRKCHRAVNRCHAEPHPRISPHRHRIRRGTACRVIPYFVWRRARRCRCGLGIQRRGLFSPASWRTKEEGWTTSMDMETMMVTMEATTLLTRRKTGDDQREKTGGSNRHISGQEKKLGGFY